MPLRKGKNSRPGLELQDRDIEIFLGLFESRLMTLEHLTRLYFNGRSEAAKKRVQQLKSGRYLGERVRNLYEPSILYLAERAFTALVERGAIHEYPSLTWSQFKKRVHVSDFTLRHERSVLDVKTSLSCALRPLSHYLGFGRGAYAKQTLMFPQGVSEVDTERRVPTLRRSRGGSPRRV